GGGSGGSGSKGRVKWPPVEFRPGQYCLVKPGFGARECQDFEVVPADPVNPVEPAPGEPITIRDVAHFPVNKGELVIQPGGGQHTVNMKGNVYSTAAMHELTLPLLGEPLTVQFIPVDFAFDFGDGTPVVSGAGAGAAYPEGNIRHVYRKVGTFTITVTTTWMANYKDPDSGQWVPIPGTLTTTVQSPPQTVNEYHIVLTDPTG
ncbi:MAG: hypothetical protein Q4B12_05945, partial [Bowdeniella nasicola]|nr:hypothetical protein [Bowdeniella nasicola]